MEGRGVTEAPFGKLLVANRGEIAARVIRACRELGIRSVAVYSKADENALHRRLADEAYLLGPAPAAESYLDVERLREVIGASGAEAVHPGYGFLSESAGFARAVIGSGASWVGPAPEAMDLVGDKVRAKELAARAGVPVLPGYSGEDQAGDTLTAEAERIGYPVLVKAAAGGGGRGMRAIAEPGELGEAVRGARREAEAAFGDGTVFLEKLLQSPRHIEVQVLGDHHGNVVHLYERECSIQRRHQKVVEEAPSPALDAGLREEICAAAVRLALEAGYTNAGTVEFLLEGQEFYFLEMNARLQVEHPVTELVTDLDLVALQLSVAAGDPLPVSQEMVSTRGSAIEVRVYAEDESGLPAGGRLLAFDPPEGAGIRNDTGFEAGDTVSLNYDSMLAKLIVSDPDRPAAVRRLRRALSEYAVLGLPTNLPLLRRISEHPAFDAGETTIDFLEGHRLLEPPEKPGVPEEAVLLAAAGDLHRSHHGGDAGDPFEAGPWRPGGHACLRYEAGGVSYELMVERAEVRSYELRLGEHEAEAEVLSLRDGRLSVVLDGESVTCGFSPTGGGLEVSLGGMRHLVERTVPPRVDLLAAASGGASLTAPMPGTVARVLVGEGESVREGQTLLVLEAMKMEQPVKAPHAGMVVSLPFSEGALVPGGAVLAEVEEA
jgi:3-methylcrotonyl-CoA carboxylase alpha subunit